jgi:hypothetical protein
VTRTAASQRDRRRPPGRTARRGGGETIRGIAPVRSRGGTCGWSWSRGGRGVRRGNRPCTIPDSGNLWSYAASL